MSLLTNAEYRAIEPNKPLATQEDMNLATIVPPPTSFAPLATSIPTAQVVPAPNEASLCRICLSMDNPEDLIAPCRCTGRNQYVHRRCLNHHRSDINRPQNIYNCNHCGADYCLYPKQGESTTERKRRAKFHYLVLRDFFVVFCIIQLLILISAIIVRAIDEAIAYCVDSCQPPTNVSGESCVTCPPIKHFFFPSKMEDYERTTYYICGVIVFLACIGFFGLCHSCCCSPTGMTPTPSYQRRRNRHHRRNCCDDCLCICDCGDNPRASSNSSSSSSSCNCPKGSCTGNSDGKHDECGILIVIIVVIVICFAIVGVFYGLVLSTALFQRIVQRHMHHLELKLLAHDYPVADLASPLNETIPYAQVISDVRDMI